MSQPPTPSSQVKLSSTSKHATFVDHLIRQTTNLNLTETLIPVNPQQPSICLTENNSATYLSSGNPCLDFFFHIVPDTPPSTIIYRLQLSWAHDPLTTLKLICNLRGIRGTGKSDKESFYTAALWLHKHHPKSLALNLPVFASFGYLKDLLEILFRILEGPYARSKMKTEWLTKKFLKGKGKKRKFHFLKKKKYKEYIGDQAADKKRLRAQITREERIKENNATVMEEKQRARILRKERQLSKTNKALEMYTTDKDYQFLHEQISTLFANLLKADIQCLNSGEAKTISLAGKWCPTIDSSYDKYTLIFANIAKKVFPREFYPEYEGIENAHYVYRVRDRLRKEVLVPLHKALKLPEVYMSAREWSSIPYNRVASVAMKTYTDIFLHRDNLRFREFLEKVKLGNAKIAAGALLPHDLIKSSFKRGSGALIVAELQWKRMVDDLLKKGKLSNCIAVCDVSGSMFETPLEVATALGLLVSELSEEPWKGHVITFSHNPQIHLIKGTNLRAKSQFIEEMDWGQNTDFQKVFDLILEVAVNGRLSEEQMIQKVFVFSDMEFDEASMNPWETDYQVIRRKFRNRGYERVPEIVFWNLRNSTATPVTATQNGVAMLGGFSKNLLTLFLEEGGAMNLKDVQTKLQNVEDSKVSSVKQDLNPETVMETAISGEEYQKLAIYD